MTQTPKHTPHTPGPWRAVAPIGPGNWAVQSERLNASGTFYVAVTGEHAESEANARLIVTAVNSHAELLAICHELDRWERNPDRYAGDLADLAHQARAAIAKATEGE